MRKKHFDLEYIDNEKIALISMNREPVNAFTTDSYAALKDIIKTINENDNVNVAILNSKLRLFSAGADIKELESNTAKESAIRKDALRQAISYLYNCKVPLISAVNGAVIGAGAILATCADIIIASEDAYFSIPEINIGVVGGGKGLTKILPSQKVRTLALTGESITAMEVEKYGGVEKVVEENKLEEETIKLAKNLTEKGGMALRKWKESLLLTESVGFLEGFYIEQSLSQDLNAFK